MLKFRNKNIFILKSLAHLNRKDLNICSSSKFVSKLVSYSYSYSYYYSYSHFILLLLVFFLSIIIDVKKKKIYLIFYIYLFKLVQNL